MQLLLVMAGTEQRKVSSGTHKLHFYTYTPLSLSTIHSLNITQDFVVVTRDRKDSDSDPYNQGRL
jgi:hypothetical protein